MNTEHNDTNSFYFAFTANFPSREIVDVVKLVV